MKTLVIMVGIPGSGKTTLRNNLFKDAKIICPDDIIDYSKDNMWTPERAWFAWKSSNIQLLQLLQQPEDCLIVFDATMVDRKRRCKYIRFGKEYGANVVALFCNTINKICYDRNQTRPYYRKVPDDTFDDMSSRLAKPSLDEGFDLVIEYNNGKFKYEGNKDILDFGGKECQVK